ICLDVSRLPTNDIIDRAATFVPELAKIQDLAKMLTGGVVNQFMQAGGKDVYILISPIDFSPNKDYRPRVVIPLSANADEPLLKTVLNTLQFPVQKRLGDALIASTQATVDRMSQSKPDPRPELLPALEAT